MQSATRGHCNFMALEWSKRGIPRTVRVCNKQRKCDSANGMGKVVGWKKMLDK